MTCENVAVTCTKNSRVQTRYLQRRRGLGKEMENVRYNAIDWNSRDVNISKKARQENGMKYVINVGYEALAMAPG